MFGLTRRRAHSRRADDIHDRYATAIALHQEMYRCVRGDFTGAQYARFVLWGHVRGRRGDPAPTVVAWAQKTRHEFALFLYAAGKIGADDTDEDALRASIGAVDALGAELRGGL